MMEWLTEAWAEIRKTLLDWLDKLEKWLESRQK